MIKGGGCVMKRCICVLAVLVVLMTCVVSDVFAVIPIPARIGGAIKVNDNQLAQADAAGYRVTVTKQDGTPYSPTAETAGLNASNWYTVDIPMYDANDQPSGAQEGEIAVIHVFSGEMELTVTSPANGQITVGASGSATRIDIIAHD